MAYRNKVGKGELLALFSAFCYGISSVVQAWAMVKTPLYVGAALKSLPVWIISTIVFISNKKKCKYNKISKQRITVKIFLYLLILGTLFYVLGNTTIFAALKYGGVVISTPIMGTQAIWISILAYFILGEDINKEMITGMIIAIFGTLILTMGRSSSSVHIDNWKLAVFLSFITALSFALGGILQRFLLTRKGVSVWTLMFYSLTSAQIILHILMIISGEITYYSQLNIVLFMKLMLSGIFSAFAVISITKSMIYTQAAVAVTINSLQTGVAPILARLFLKEELNLLMSIGISLIVIGVIIVRRKTPNNSK